MSSKKRRRQFTAQHKAAIMRRMMFEQAAVSDLADEYKIQPSQLYHWHKQVQDNLEAAFAGDRGKRATQHQQAQ
ncbi:MAG: transposase, partial [Proteobacteria bacterium]|nr:transposase [Pseudomonadota bacterium]